MLRQDPSLTRGLRAGLLPVKGACISFFDVLSSSCAFSLFCPASAPVRLDAMIARYGEFRVYPGWGDEVQIKPDRALINLTDACPWVTVSKKLAMKIVKSTFSKQQEAR